MLGMRGRNRGKGVNSGQKATIFSIFQIVPSVGTKRGIPEGDSRGILEGRGLAR